MIQIEKVGKAVADAIAKTGRYRADEQKVAMTLIAAGVKAEDLVDSISRLGNISADRQELEKSGILVSAAHTPSAFAQHVKAALVAAKVALPIKVS